MAPALPRASSCSEYPSNYESDVLPVYHPRSVEATGVVKASKAQASSLKLMPAASPFSGFVDIQTPIQWHPNVTQ